MLNKEQVYAFINYHYTPFDKRQCLKRLLVIWIASFAFCFISNRFFLWFLPLGVIALFSSLILIALIAKYSQSQISRYLCDGIFSLNMALVCNLASYRIMTIQIGSNWILAIILMSLLVICIFVFLLVTVANIKSEKFSKAYAPAASHSIPFLSGAIGILAARVLLQGKSQQVALAVLAGTLLLVSFVMGMVSVNLLKALLYRRYHLG